MAEEHKMGSKGCKCDDGKEYLQFYCGDSCSCCDSASLSQGKNKIKKMNKSQLKNIIRRSIKELMTEQQGPHPFETPTLPSLAMATISQTNGPGGMKITCPNGYVFGDTMGYRAFNTKDVCMQEPVGGNSSYDGVKEIIIPKCRKLDLNYVAPPVNPVEPMGVDKEVVGPAEPNNPNLGFKKINPTNRQNEKFSKR